MLRGATVWHSDLSLALTRRDESGERVSVRDAPRCATAWLSDLSLALTFVEIHDKSESETWRAPLRLVLPLA